MKKHLFLASLLLATAATLSAQTQPKPYLWPIAGQQAGTDIISAPQHYIQKELNFASLFIGAPEGTAVVSPVDGVIASIGLAYLSSLTYSSSWDVGGKSFDDALKAVRAKPDKTKDQQFISGSIGIRAKDGSMIHISGFSGDKIFKTGQALKQGDTIGTVTYSYVKIKEPSIQFSISRQSKVADPMSPFGIKSSFIPPQEIKPIVSLTTKQAREDFTIYIDALREAFPGLYDVVTPQELDQYVAQTLSTIDSYGTTVPFLKFWDIMQGALAKIHDSHIWMQSLPWKTTQTTPTLRTGLVFGWINEIPVVTNAVKANERLIGRQIASVNGMSADSIKKMTLSKVTSYDAKVQSVKDYYLISSVVMAQLKGATDMDITFADGQNLKIKGIPYASKFANSIAAFAMANYYPEGYKTRIINDSTAYLGISTFELNQVQVEEIGAFLDSISGNKPNLVIDVRNNSGGHVEVLEKLYSFIAGQPFTVEGYSHVNKRGGFESFKYSLNRSVDDEPFAEYLAEQGKHGFFDRPQHGPVIKADSAINYKGRIYMLANERSVSAATLFPAMLVRNHRGVVVGRETSTAYHFMNALKFADIRLPNSMITITIPLVKCVFDTVVNDRAPYGRGVLPDYFVPITIEEMSSKNGDAILNRALKLIQEGKYLTGPDTFM